VYIKGTGVRPTPSSPLNAPPLPRHWYHVRNFCTSIQIVANFRGDAKDPNKFEFIRSIAEFIQPSVSKNRPENVGLIYLAFCQSLQSEHIARIDAMPSFDIKYRGETHTVRTLKTKLNHTTQNLIRISQKISVNGNQVETDDTAMAARLPEKRSKDRLSLQMAIFKKRVKIAAEHPAPRDQVIDGPSPDHHSAARSPSCMATSNHEEETEENVLIRELRKVSSLEMAQEEVAGQLAQAY
jgi:hypothetical protein